MGRALAKPGRTSTWAPGRRRTASRMAGAGSSSSGEAARSSTSAALVSRRRGVRLTGRRGPPRRCPARVAPSPPWSRSTGRTSRPAPARRTGRWNSCSGGRWTVSPGRCSARSSVRARTAARCWSTWRSPWTVRSSSRWRTARAPVSAAPTAAPMARTGSESRRRRSGTRRPCRFERPTWWRWAPTW